MEQSDLNFMYASLCDLDIPREKWFNYLQQWILLSDAAIWCVWYGSALFAIYPLVGFQSKMGE